MNLLLHFRLAERDLGPAAAPAAMLPDLWRMVDPRARARRYDGPPLAHHLVDLARAIDHHLEADREFHRAPVFLDGQHTAREILAAAGWPRPGLLAHPACELALDGALLQVEGIAATLGRLRLAVDAMAPGSIRALARAFDLAPIRGPQADDFDTGVANLLARLTRSEWPRLYTDADGLARTLGSIAARVGLERGKANSNGFGGLLEQAVTQLPQVLALRWPPKELPATAKFEA